MDPTGGDTVPRNRAEAPSSSPPQKLLPPPHSGEQLLLAPPERHRPWLRWLLILLAILLVVFLVYHFWPSKKAPAPVAATPVGVASVSTGNMNVVLTGLGTVTPLATVTVQTQISGQLMSVGFQEGQLVKQGQFLAQIDPRPYQVALEQAQGALAKDTASLGQAKSDLARYLLLSRQDSIAKQTVTDQEYLVAQDQGTVKDDQAAVDSAKLNLTYCHIVSPVSGRAGLRLVDPGNYVQTSSATGLVVVTQLQPISVIFVLPEDDIPALAEQMQNGGNLGVSAYDRTNSKVVATGTLATLDNTVDTTTGTVKLRATFPNSNLALFPNEFVNARLLLKTLDQVPEVPVRAVQYGAPGTFVYVVTTNQDSGNQNSATQNSGTQNSDSQPKQTAHVQVITTGITDGDHMQVTKGLKAGDVVVVDGTDQLRDGAEVKISKDAAASSATSNDGPGAPPGQQPQNNKPASSSGT